jgi:hypothetical protein
LYSNQDNYFNNWSSLTQSEEVVEELSIQQTKYDHRSLPSLRTAEAEAAEWNELERWGNQELQHNGTRIRGIITYKSGNLPGVLSFSVIEILMMVVASFVPNFLTGLFTGAGLIGIIMTSSGFSRLLPDLPKIFCRFSISYTISYMIFGSWAIKLGHNNNFLGPLSPDEPKMTGEEMNMNEFGVKVTHSGWWGFPEIVIAILVCTWLLFFVAQKLKERARPASRVIQAKVYFNVQLS